LKDEKKKKTDLLEELNELKLKVTSLNSELNLSKDTILNLESELTEAKNNENMLSSEIRNLQTEIKYIEANKKSVDILDENVHSLDKLRENLEQKLELKEKKIEELLQDKEILLKEKSEVLSGKNEILQEIKEKELELQEKGQDFAKLREKYKQSSSDLLGKSMQIEKLVKKDKIGEEFENKISNLENKLEQQISSKTEMINDFEEKINDLEEELKISYEKLRELEHSNGQIKSLEVESNEDTQILSSMDAIIEKIKVVLPQGKSNIRLVLPEIADLQKHELIKIIKKIPNKIRINIGANIEDPLNNAIANDLKNFCQLTSCINKKLIGLNIDASKVLIAVFTGKEVVGIYTEVLEVVDLLKPAIMEPFIKGIKL